MTNEGDALEDRAGPLADLRVVELGNIVAGPFAGSVLADLGADVAKIEPPGSGDFVRSSGDAGEAIFDALNRNKRSVALDLKREADREALYEIVEVADVFIENLGPGTPERLGIDYPSLKRHNPGLIYLSIAGFREGPYGDYPGMDVVAEAMSGLMGVTGEPGRQPLRVGTSIADMGAALYGVLGVMIALRHRERTGEGQRVRGSLFESAAHWMGYWITYADRFGRDPEPLGASHPNWGLYDAFETDGGWLFVGATSDRHWKAFCELTGLDELLEDDRFATSADRLRNKTELLRTVQDRLRGMDREALFTRLAENGVPVAPVRDPTDLTDDPSLEAAGLLAEFEPAEASTDGELRSVLAPIGGERFGPVQYRDPPDIGEHTAEVRTEWVDTASNVSDQRRN